MSVPYPDPVVVSLLSNLPAIADLDGRASTLLDSTFPALRVTKVGDLEPPTTAEGTPIYRVEVWASDEIAAGEIAWRIKNAWPTATRERVLDAVVHGRWIDTDPRPQPDPETGSPRYLVDVGIRLSGAQTS